MLRFRREAHRAWAAKLGLTTDSFQQCLQTRDLAEVNRRLKALTQRVKDCYRDLALELHPDHHPNDPEREQQLKELNDAKTSILGFLEGIEVRPRRPMPRPVVRIMTFSAGANGVTSTVTNSGSAWFSRGGPPTGSW